MASDDQRDYTKKLLEGDSGGYRGVFDGDYYQRFFGLLGEVLCADLLGVPRPVKEGGFDGGYDLEYNGIKIDVKTVMRTVKPLLKYGCNVPSSQLGENYCADVYFFLSYDKSAGLFWFCGWISKKAFLEKAVSRKKGDLVPSGESNMTVSYDFHELPIAKLSKVLVPDDLCGVCVDC